MVTPWPVPGILRMLARGWIKRCPRCGSGSLFQGWFKIVERCPRCALMLEREDGGWLGAVVINVGAAQTIVVAYVVAGLVATWPHPPIAGLILTGVALVGAFTVWFLPRSKTIWLAFELWIRRNSSEDIADVEG